MKRKSATKLTALVLTGVMTAGLLAGCGNKDGGNSTPADGDAQQGGQEQNDAGSGSQEDNAGSSGENTPTGDKNDVNATAASNGISLPELPDGTLKLEVSITDYQQSSEGTLIQEEWQKRMEAYLGCKLDISWTSKADRDYRSE